MKTIKIGFRPTESGNSGMPNAVAERFVLLRMALRRSQAVMGELIGISVSAWGKYELGERTPTYGHLRDLQQKTGCRIEWLMDGDISNMPPRLMDRIEEAAEARLEELRKPRRGRPQKRRYD